MPVENDGVWWDKNRDDQFIKYEGEKWVVWTPGTTGPQPPDPWPDVSMATPEERRRLLRNLRQSQATFDKPFRRGEIASFKVAGGSWNEYVQIVVSLAIADTLLDISNQLAHLTRAISTLAGEGTDPEGG